MGKTIRNLGPVILGMKVARFPFRTPEAEFSRWMQSLGMDQALLKVLLYRVSHGMRSSRGFEHVGAEAMREIDRDYQTASVGRVLVFGQCGDGSYVGVGLDDRIPCWIMKGCLEAEHLHEGHIRYPHSLGLFLLRSVFKVDFPLDAYEAQRKFDPDWEF